jgi:nucleoside-diphosphate-sugar epimerase
LLAGTPGSMLELVQQIAVLLGKPPPKSATPAWLLKAVARVADLVSTVTHKEPVITPEMAAGLGGEATVDCSKAQAQLGYKLVPLPDMVRDCYDWLVKEGRV